MHVIIFALKFNFFEIEFHSFNSGLLFVEKKYFQEMKSHFQYIVESFVKKQKRKFEDMLNLNENPC